MLKPRRPLRLSALALLERVYIHKPRVRFQKLMADYPGVPQSVLWRNLNTLVSCGFAKRRAARPIGAGAGSRFFYYYMTPRGRAFLGYLYPWRDWWELLELRDLRALAGAEDILERLDGIRMELFPGDGGKVPRRSYWCRPSGWQPAA